MENMKIPLPMWLSKHEVSVFTVEKILNYRTPALNWVFSHTRAFTWDTTICNKDVRSPRFCSAELKKNKNVIGTVYADQGLDFQSAWDGTISLRQLRSMNVASFSCPCRAWWWWPGSRWWWAERGRACAGESSSSARTLTPGCWAQLRCSQSESSGHTQTCRRSACPAPCWSCHHHSNT